MQLNVTIDLGDLWSDEMSVEDILTEELQSAARLAVAKKVGGDAIKKLADKMALEAVGVVESMMRERVDSFLSEDIALTGKWGDTAFVGSIEDLMKKKFDETILGPVDSSGRKLNGCTSSSHTYAEWKISKAIQDFKDEKLKYARNSIIDQVKSEIKETIEAHKSETIKDEVGMALNAILGK